MKANNTKKTIKTVALQDLAPPSADKVVGGRAETLGGKTCTPVWQDPRLRVVTPV